MREPEELRPLTAGRLLAIWREAGKRAEEPLERALLCNAQILAESCFFRGEPMFQNGEAVLDEMTAREMERWMRNLAKDAVLTQTVNPAFDWEQFERMRGEML